VTDRKKMEEYCSTGQSPQRAVVPMEKKKKKCLLGDVKRGLPVEQCH
jgi:hypothetical protein